MELFAKIIHFCKRLHLRCLTGFFMCLCCVRENYLSINFPAQSYLLLSCLWWFKALSFSTFPIYMNLIHLHYNWQQNRIVKIGDINLFLHNWGKTLSFKVVPEYQKKKARKVCIFGAFLSYQVSLMIKYAWL